jgi:molybdate-binding protein
LASRKRIAGYSEFQTKSSGVAAAVSKGRF